MINEQPDHSGGATPGGSTDEVGSPAAASPGLSWSHDALHFDERVDRYPVRAHRNASVAESEGVAPLFSTAASSFAPAR
jgi:hypothetical protein